ncbi:MAG: HAMP domain-containing sensor histidine kinase [Neorhizobium sp.]|nr:HAMP domain-containing sensor histidine kinase [Neorhizobium sp.]
MPKFSLNGFSLGAFSLTGRLWAVVSVSLIILWLAIVSSFYLRHDWEEENFWPAPLRVARIVALIEDADANHRYEIISALRSQTLDLHIESPAAPQAGQPAGQSKSESPNQPPDQSQPSLSSTATNTTPAIPVTRAADEALTRRYAASLRGRAFSVVQETLPLPQSGSATFSRQGRRALQIRIGMTDGSTLVIESVAPLLVTPFGLPTGIFAGFVGSLIALAALLVMYREIRPLTKLARAVDRIGIDGETVELPNVRRHSAELSTLVAAFERLQTRLTQLLRGRMALFGGISHDLRTYATRLRLRTDLIPDDAQRLKAENDIADMIKLLDDALLATRVGAGDLSEELVDMHELVSGEVKDMHASGFDVHFNGTQAIGRARLLGDRLALRRVVTNLVENAVKYGQSAQVSLTTGGTDIVLVVEDEGTGMDEELIEVATEPFVRAEASRSRDTGGSGLGLAVVKSLVEAHGGTIILENRSSQGLRVTITLPRYHI